ncbi:MAG: type VI secretion system tube protein Hcp [Labilithrix sp.]|nr:type VI secretion system tube protein Hcp [Labilithrix sp.]MCW5811441.1 type VI secretion system tube protein Hcp [Labilithrix sp.]
MAQFGIFVAFGDNKSAKIKGNSAVAGYEDWVLGHSVQLNSRADRTDGPAGKTAKKVTAHVDGLSLMLHGGSATAEMYKTLFATTALAQVHIHQCLQPVDKAAKQAPDLVQKIELKDVFITSVSENWMPDGERSVQVTLEFAHIMFTEGKKTADFTVRNLTKAGG